ncbi:MAG: DUF2905 domain-containing protein [Bacteroidota bacterium]
MADVGSFGRLFIVLGIVLVLIGLGLTLGPRIPWLGKLPGDFTFGGSTWRVYVPLGTSILISVVVSLLLLLFRRR